MGCPQFSDYYKETLPTRFRTHKPNSWEKPPAWSPGVGGLDPERGGAFTGALRIGGAGVREWGARGRTRR